MRSLNPIYNPESAYIADTIATVQISSASAIVAQDMPASAEYMRITSAVPMYVNFHSTAVLEPTASIAGTSSSTGLTNVIPANNDRIYKTHGSTGYSMTSTSTGYATVEFWGI